MLDRENISLEGQDGIYTALNILPPYDFKNPDSEKRNEDLQLILSKIFCPEATELGIRLYRTNVQTPYNLYPAIMDQFPTDQQGIDPIDDLPVAMTILGKIRINRLPRNNYFHNGYEFHLSAPIENMHFSEMYLSHAYNTEIVSSSLRGRKIIHTEDYNKEEGTIIHTFADRKVLHKIILHIENESQKELLPMKKIFERPKVLSHARIPMTNLAPSLFDNDTDFNINKFPVSDDNEKGNREKIFIEFIQKATSFLRIDAFTLNYNKKIIYKNSDENKVFRTIKCGPLSILLNQTSLENNPGIEALLALIMTRINYAFDIKDQEVIVTSGSSRKTITNYYEMVQNRPYEIKTDQNSEKTLLIYTDENENEISFRMPNTNENIIGRGAFKWNLIIPDTNYDKVLEMICNLSKGRKYPDELSPKGIRTSYPGGYSYLIEATKASDIIL